MKNVYSFINSIALGIGVLSCVISFSDSVPFKVACAFLCLFFSICYFAIDIKAFGKFYKSIVGLIFTDDNKNIETVEKKKKTADK